MQKPSIGRLIGYARVSTEDQELRLQLDALERAGCSHIYKEHRSATRGRRPQLELALVDLMEHDVLVVWKLDRLGRNMRQLYAILDKVHARGASFKSLTEGIDLTTPTGELMFGMLGHFAQFEAAMTAKRTAAGIKAIQERGLHYGGRPKLSDAKVERLLRWRKAKVTRAEVARRLHISPGSVRNYELRARARKR